MKLKCITATETILNPTVYFELDGRLLIVKFITPYFNDYGLWKIDDIDFAHLPYDPSKNTCELTPFVDFPELEITKEQLEFLKIYQTNISDEEYDRLTENKGYDPDINGDDFYFYELEAGREKYKQKLSFYVDNEMIHINEWKKKKDERYFYQIFIPILEGFKNSFSGKRKIK